MSKRFFVIIEDDFEVMGNGVGNVAELQYLPALALMNLAEKHGLALTFMVDVAHRLALGRHAVENPELRAQMRLWDETILLMKERGFDVQLHLHPQWINARYEKGYHFVRGDWNIGRYKPQEQHELISKGKRFLESLLCVRFPDYRLIAFKAGSWGLQPSESLLNALNELEIRIVIGVRSGLYVPKAGVDYSDVEEEHLPYVPKCSDITRVAARQNGLVVIPLQRYDAHWIDLGRLAVGRLLRRVKTGSFQCFYHGRPIPKEIKNMSPVSGSRRISLSARPYRTHLKIGNQSFSYLKSSFDGVIRRLRKLPSEAIPIVIESHTKQHPGHYGDIDKFFGYVRDTYGDECEFGDMTSLLAAIDKSKISVRVENGN